MTRALVQRRRQRVWQRGAGCVLAVAAACALMLLARARRGEHAGDAHAVAWRQASATHAPAALPMIAGGTSSSTGVPAASVMAGDRRLEAGARVTTQVHGETVLSFMNGRHEALERATC